MGNARKSALFGAVGVATVVGLGSVAFACTTYKGIMTVTGDGGATASTAIGNNRGMGYCAESSGAQIPKPGNFMVAVAPYVNTDGLVDASRPSQLCPDSKLGASGELGTGVVSSRVGRIYTVTWSNTAGNGDCMNPLGTQAASVQPSNGNPTPGPHPTNWANKGAESAHSSEFTVNPDGTGSGQYKVDTTNLPAMEGAVCVSDTGGGQGNQVPVTFL